jgi:hypothetical protein
MPSLHELQTELLNAVLDGEPDRALPFIFDSGITPARRLQVHTDNARANFTAGLRSSFPVIHRLVGAQYFEQCAARFQRSHPSRSGDLQHAGRLFPRFLAQLHAQDEYCYLADVARLEQLCEESLLAADQSALDLAKLARIKPVAYDEICFRLHPAARVFDSPYPCLRIRAANLEAASEPEIIDLKSAPDRLLLMRREQRLEFHRLAPGEHAFLRALHSGARFAAAIEAGNAAHDEFDAGAALQRFVAARAIVDFQ